ncbi:MAG: flagellar protein FlgN [Burkholderiaceae bacterium]|nr:flagellar protein FlgN [Burkholderiaceae bacterium]
MTDTLQQLHACLNQEISLVKEFSQLLEQEAQLLIDAAPTEALTNNTAEKNRLADQIAAWDEQRLTLLTELGYSPDKDGLNAAAAQHSELDATCQTLYQLADNARQLNDSNGQLISTFMAHNQQALDTLARLADPGHLYDASGRSRPGSKKPKTNIKAG